LWTGYAKVGREILTRLAKDPLFEVHIAAQGYSGKPYESFGCKVYPVASDGGKRHLTGEDASWLIRNRNAPQGDFFREANQHSVITAIFNRLKGLTTAEKTKFYLSMIPETNRVERNFDTGEIIPRFADTEDIAFNSIILNFDTGLLRSSYVPLKTEKTVSVSTSTATATGTATTTVDATTTTPQSASGQAGMYTLIPTAGMDNYTAIREFIMTNIK